MNALENRGLCWLPVPSSGVMPGGDVGAHSMKLALVIAQSCRRSAPAAGAAPASSSDLTQYMHVITRLTAGASAASITPPPFDMRMQRRMPKGIALLACPAAEIASLPGRLCGAPPRLVLKLAAAWQAPVHPLCPAAARMSSEWLGRTLAANRACRLDTSTLNYATSHLC